MATTTTTIRLDAEEEAILDELAELYGGRSKALKRGLQMLALAKRREDAVDQVLREWEEELGPVSDDRVATIAKLLGI